MRYLITAPFSQAEQAMRETYAAFDALATAEADGTAEYEAADLLEREAYRALLNFPATTAGEVRRKLMAIEAACDRGSRDPEHVELAPIKMDLLQLSRPNASPKMVEAFDTWAAARTVACFIEGDADADHPLLRAESDAFAAVQNTPCTTPGDFIVKSYVDLLDDQGGIPEADRHPLPYWPFEVNGKDMDCSGTHNLIAAEARLRDIRDCDLGRCMIALGKVDFDAAAWMRQATRVGKSVGVMLDEDGNRAGLWLGELGGSIGSMPDLLQMLTAGGLDEVSTQRCAAIADEIEANYPHLVSRRGASGDDPAEAPVHEAAE